MIPENEIKENTSTTQLQTKNTPSHETLANPTIMFTPPAADIALTIPTITVTPPDTVESIELCSNSVDVQNPFTMKHTIDQMPSQNNSKIAMIEIVELTPLKQLLERILHSAKKVKTDIPLRKSKNDKTPTVTVEMYNNLKCAFNKIDDEMTFFAKRYQEEQKEITTEITDIMRNIITPIAEENTILRKDLQTAKKTIDELNTLILDLTTKNKNKITKNKILITNKINEINNQMTNTMDRHIGRHHQYFSQQKQTKQKKTQHCTCKSKHKQFWKPKHFNTNGFK